MPIADQRLSKILTWKMNEFGQVIESIHTIPLFDMNGKPKMSINWEEAKPYFMYPAEERNLHPP